MPAVEGIAWTIYGIVAGVSFKKAGRIKPSLTL
jgi:hypothetical protein